MTITYCEKCGALMRVKKTAETTLCEECKAGRKPRQRVHRHSDMIPRKRLHQGHPSHHKKSH
jgi:DNA-directed RNA polymerase subunit M/transcription elongation factor TFIIS